jgi:hypothetical protein
MQKQIDGAAGIATPEAGEPLSWQATAVEEYKRSRSIRHADLRVDLSARVLVLTGRRTSLEEVYTDGHLAVAGVDDATFRLYQSGDLVLVRKCAYFESLPIDNLSDLGYALSAWEPLHADCEEYSSEEFPDF